MLRKAIQKWNTYWFQSSEEYQYGLLRILVVAGFALFFPDVLVGPMPPVEFFDPATVGVRLFGLPYLTPAAVHLLTPLYRAALFTACIGLATRPSLLVLAAIRIYSDAVICSFGFYDHRTSVVDPLLLILALSPGVTDFSLDALLRNAWQRFKGNGVSWWRGFQFGSYAKWPARFVLVFMAMNYFSAGWSKVRFGDQWLNGERMAFYLTVPGKTYYTTSARIPEADKWRDSIGLEAFTYDVRLVTPVGKMLGSSRLMCILIAWMTLVFEMGFIAAIFSNRLRLLLLLGGVAFHLGIMLTMHLNFFPYFLAYIFLLNWAWLRKFYVTLRGTFAPRGVPAMAAKEARTRAA
jgi:hypothetical protein